MLALALCNQVHCELLEIYYVGTVDQLVVEGSITCSTISEDISMVAHPILSMRIAILDFPFIVTNSPTSPLSEPLMTRTCCPSCKSDVLKLTELSELSSIKRKWSTPSRYAIGTNEGQCNSTCVSALGGINCNGES